MFATGFVAAFLATMIAWALVDDGNTKKFKAEHPRLYNWCGLMVVGGVLLMLLSLATLLFRWLP